MKITLESERIKVNAAQLKELIKLDFELIKQGIYLPPLLIWGESGVGKTTIVHDTLNEIKNTQNIDVKVFEYRLGTKTSANALGLHFVDTQTKTTVRYLNTILEEIVQRSENGQYSVLFLDEFSLGWDAANSILDALNFKEKRLDGRDVSKVLIIAAGNYIKEYVNRFNPAIWTRFARVNYEPDNDEVADYIYQKTSCVHVPTYLRVYPEEMIVKNDSVYVLTPREWEAIATLCCGIKQNETNKEILFKRIETIGGNAISNFLILRDKMQSFPTIEKILENPEHYFNENGVDNYEVQSYFLYYFLNNPYKILLSGSNKTGFINILNYYLKYPNPIGRALIKHAVKFAASNNLPTKLKNKIFEVGEKYKEKKY